MKKSVLIGLAVALVLIAGLAWAARPPARPQLKQVTECVEVDIEAPAVAYLGQQVTLYGEVTNCGDEAGWCELTGSLTHTPSGSTFVTPYPARIYLAAGETRSKTVKIQIPNPGPPWDEMLVGTYTACVIAKIGEAEATDCTSMEVQKPSKKAPRRAPRRR